MTPNGTQTESLIRAVLLVIGTLLTQLGWTTSDQWGTVINLSMQIIGPALMLAPIIWSMIVHSQQGKLAAVAAMPVVEKIVVSSPALATVTQSDKVVAPT